MMNNESQVNTVRRQKMRKTEKINKQLLNIEQGFFKESYKLFKVQNQGLHLAFKQQKGFDVFFTVGKIVIPKKLTS